MPFEVKVQRILIEEMHSLAVQTVPVGHELSSEVSEGLVEHIQSAAAEYLAQFTSTTLESLPPRSIE